MATSLPTPGQLIVDNVTLLAGSPTAFNERYGHHLTPNTFAKPANHGPANCLLHFLLCLIDPDLTEPLFKPCFPILDRDQERDFRRVVDSRLAVLEKTKLLPSGSARKSVIASGGGDRFLDLVWSLSTLAVQQTCLRHPAYGSSSRLRMVSHNSRSDVLSHQSSARSNRSLFSVVSTRSERPQEPQHAPPSSANAASRHRRFLGVGMLSASEQRARDAENARARIDAERVALERTVNVGKEGATTWASEADSLREKIGQFEAKLARLKGQLADMGFDENGVDIRGNDQEALLSARPPTPPSSKSALSADPSSTISDSSTKTPTSLTPSVEVEPDSIPAPITSGSELRPSPSGDDFDHFKTSPFESTESGSSVDDLQERDLSSDLSKLLTFSAETASARREVEDSLKNPSMEEISLLPRTGEDNAAASDIVNLVRAATNELQQATDRMDEIRRERARENGEKTSEEGPSSSPSTVKSLQEYGTAAEMSSSSVEVEADSFAKKEDSLKNPVIAPEPEGIPQPNPEPLEKVTSEAVEKHEQTVNDATKVRNDAARLSIRSTEIIKESDPKSQSTPALACPNGQDDKKWLTHRRSELHDRQPNNDDVPVSGSSKKVSRASVDASRDLTVASKAFRNSTPAECKVRSEVVDRRLTNHRSLDSLTLSAAPNRTVKISPRYDTNCSVRVLARGNVESLVALTPAPTQQLQHSSCRVVKASRSVRFAELPPSYTRSRETERGPTSGRPARIATEVHPSRSGTQIESNTQREDENDQHTETTETSSEGGSNPPPSEKEESSKKTEAAKEEQSESLHDTTVSLVMKDESSSDDKPAAPKHPRLQRRHTPQRIVSQKDVFQRSVAPTTRRNGAPPRPESWRMNPSRMLRLAEVEADQAASVSNDATIKEAVVSNQLMVPESKSKQSSTTQADTPLANCVASLESTLSGPPPSKDDLTVVQRPNTRARQRSDMSEPVPSSERQFAAVVASTSPVQQTVEEVVSVAPSSAFVGDAGSSEPAICSADKLNAEETNMFTPDLSTLSEEAQQEGESGLDGPSSLVAKSDSSGSMIGSSEEWPGSQLSEEAAPKSSPDSTPSRTSKNCSKKTNLLRKSSGGMFGPFHVGKGRNNSFLKDAACVAGSGDSTDSLVSAGRPPLPQKSGTNKPSSGGFFAGETAQWQENVQSNSSSTDGGAVNGSARMSDEARVGARNGRGGAPARAASANPPARKSRVLSFRARLAALK